MGNIFVSYSHNPKDEGWRDLLLEHLAPLKRIAEIETWSDQQIESGEEWDKEIKAALHSADVAIVLLSTPVLNSTYIMETEVPILLDKKEREGILFIPVIVRPCLWQEFDWISRIQGAIGGNTPLAKMDEVEQEEVLVDLAARIKRFLQDYKPERVSHTIHSAIEAPESESDIEREPQQQKPIPDDTDSPSDQPDIEYLSGDEFKNQLINSLVKSIQSADVEELPKTLAMHLALDTKNVDLNALTTQVASKLLEKGFRNVVQDAIYKTCQSLFSTDKQLSALDDQLLRAQRARLTQAISQIMGLLALHELDESVFLDKNFIQKTGNSDNYFIVQGISTPLGAELLLRRVDSSEQITPEFHPSVEESIAFHGQARIQDASRKKWSKKSNADFALIDIWNAVLDHEDPENSRSRKTRDQKLSPVEIKQLNAKIDMYRGHKMAPRCFFIAEDISDSDRIKELCDNLSKKLPALMAVGFRSDQGTSIFLTDDINIWVEIESIYNRFNFLKYQQGGE